MVTRYDPNAIATLMGNGVTLHEAEMLEREGTGSYVTHADYKALEADATVIANANNKLVSNNMHLTSEIERLTAELAECRADVERMKWIQENEGCNLISDDDGRWAVSTSGFQHAPQEGGFTEVVDIVSFVAPEEWMPSAREAIDNAIARGK